MTIIETYGGSVSKEYLLELSKTTKRGVNAYNLMEAAKEVGFDAKGVEGDFNNLDNRLLPCIAHVTINKNYQHFVVIHDINQVKKQLTVADPARGIVKYHFNDFSKITNQYYLLLRPRKKLPILEKKDPLLTILSTFIRDKKKTFIMIFLLSILYTLLNIATSLTLKLMIDSTISRNNKNSLWIIMGIVSLVIILKSFMDLFRNKLLNNINHQLDQTLITHIYNHLISLPYLYYKNKTTGEVLSRINDLSNIKELISHLFLTLFVDLLLIIMVFIFLYLMSSLLTLIAVTMMIIYIIIVLIYNYFLDKYIDLNYEYSAKINSYIVETLSGYETIKGSKLENFVKRQFQGFYNQFINNSRKFMNIFNIQRFNKDLISDGGLVFIMMVGCLLVVNNKLTLGDLIAYNSLLVYFFNPIKNVIDFNLSYRLTKVAIKRIKELLIMPKEVLMANDQYSRQELKGNIDVRHLSYSYNGQDNLLKDLNLTIKQGSKVILYGKSGNGKSTLVKLLLQYFKLDRDMLFINNQDINDYNIKELRDNVNYLSQNEILFTDSIYNNVVLDKKVTDEQFLAAMKLSLADQIIKDHLLGYDMLLEENGHNLSGGERQRIILSRLFLEKKNIVIIDEALSEIDIPRERQILKNIFNFYQNATIIYISHRFDNSDLFDQKIKVESMG